MRILYLGIDPSLLIKERPDDEIIHFPIIKTVPLPFGEIPDFTHLIVTSPSVSRYFHANLEGKVVIAVGKKTASTLQAEQILIAKQETAEGIVELLKTLPLDGSTVLFPRSALGRDVIVNFLEENRVNYFAPVIYTTVPISTSPYSLSTIDALYFTSPSCVDAFLSIYGALPEEKALMAIGPITLEKLNSIR